MNKFSRERLGEARVVMAQYAPKEEGPMAKDARENYIWDSVDFPSVYKWPWYAKFLLRFKKPVITWDCTEDVTCAMYSKKLFGRTYITKNRITRKRSAGLIQGSENK